MPGGIYKQGGRGSGRSSGVGLRLSEIGSITPVFPATLSRYGREANPSATTGVNQPDRISENEVWAVHLGNEASEGVNLHLFFASEIPDSSVSIGDAATTENGAQIEVVGPPNGGNLHLSWGQGDKLFVARDNANVDPGEITLYRAVAGTDDFARALSANLDASNVLTIGLTRDGGANLSDTVDLSDLAENDFVNASALSLTGTTLAIELTRVGGGTVNADIDLADLRDGNDNDFVSDAELELDASNVLSLELTRDGGGTVRATVDLSSLGGVVGMVDGVVSGLTAELDTSNVLTVTLERTIGADVVGTVDLSALVTDATATNLSVGSRDADSLAVVSSTGTNAEIPSASETQAGLASAADKTQLGDLPSTWAVGAHAVGDQVAWNTKIYRCLVARDNTHTDNPATDTTGWGPGTGGGGGTSDGVANSVAVSLDGTTLTATVGRSVGEPLVDTVDLVSLEEWRGSWSELAGQTLRVGDLLEHTNRYYLVRVEHTRTNSGPDTDSTRFALLNSWGGDYSADTYYHAGSIVVYNSGIWVNDSDVSSGDVAPDTVTNTKWHNLTTFTAADRTKLDGIETGATADQTASEIVGLIEGETGANRLDAASLRNFPAASEAQAGIIEIADNDQTDDAANNENAMTPVKTRRVTGPVLTPQERTAGTETGVRRMSPADIVAMVRQHEVEGVTVADVNSRIAALVDAWALQANSNTLVPEAKVDAAITRDTELVAAIAGFQTVAQINMLIAAALAADGFVTDGGPWSDREFAADTIVRHDGATYLSNVAVPRGTSATTEPGVGGQWETYWDRLGYEDGPPNALVGLTVADEKVTFQRESGENPLELDLSAFRTAGVPGRVERVRFQAATIATFGTYVDFVPIANDPVTVLQGIGAPDIITYAGTGARYSVKAGYYAFTVRVLDANGNVFDGQNDTFVRFADADGTVLASDTEYLNDSPAGAVTHRGYLYIDADTEMSLQITGTAGSIDANSELRLIRFPTASEGGPTTRVERIAFQMVADGHDDSGDNIPTEAVPQTENPISVVLGTGSSEILSGVVGNDFVVAAGVYLVDIHIDPSEVGTQNTKIVFEIRDSSDHTILATSTSPTLSQDHDPVGIKAALVLENDTLVNLAFLRRNNDVAIPAGWTMDLIRFGGGRDTRTRETFSPTDLGEHTFNLTGAAAEIALTDSTGTAIICPADGYIIATVDVPGLGLVGAVSWMLAADLREADLAEDLTAGFYTNMANQIFFHVGTHDGAFNNNTILIQHAGDTRDDTGGAQSTILPAIAKFDIAGDLTPAPGSIAGESFTYDLAISQSGHASAARIVGFAGTDTSPRTVAVLRTVASLHAETGTISIPAGVMLASVGDSYTIRLEVYGSGVPLSDPPTAYHDARITARAVATESVHFGDIPATEGATDITDFTHDISTAGTVVGSWTVSGIASGDGNRRLYWLVPTSLDQPSAYQADGFNITSSVEAAVELTIAGVSYNAYLTEADGPYDSSSNGYTINIT